MKTLLRFKSLTGAVALGAAALLSPIHDRHVALGAKFGDFGGWSMPLEYAGGGVVAEHTAVRERVGVFDVSHLGKATVTGPGNSRWEPSGSVMWVMVMNLRCAPTKKRGTCRALIECEGKGRRMRRADHCLMN